MFLVEKVICISSMDSLHDSKGIYPPKISSHSARKLHIFQSFSWSSLVPLPPCAQIPRFRTVFGKRSFLENPQKLSHEILTRKKK